MPSVAWTAEVSRPREGIIQSPLSQCDRLEGLLILLFDRLLHGVSWKS